MSTLDFEAILRDHVRFLKDSSQAFDTGFEGEALRLSTSASVLLHDTKNSHSLLGQMGLLNPNTPFYAASIPWNPHNELPHHALVSVGMTVGGGREEGFYRAPLDDRPPHLLRWITFAQWWPDIVVDDRQGNQLTRRDVVLSLANKEGGKHVDPKLTPSYEALTRGTPFWETVTERGTKPIAGRIELYSMRQMAHELLRTLERLGYV